MMELTYFPAVGRAGVIRFLLHAANVEWKDTLIGFDDFPAVKATFPLGCVPTLTVDGTQFCQSVALYRFAAKKAGLYPKDDTKALIVDEMMDTLNECVEKLLLKGTDEEKKIARPIYQKNVMTPCFDLIESRIQAFGGGTSTLCGDFSVADIYLMTMVQFYSSGKLDYLDKDFFKDYPGIGACVESATKHKVVTAYLSSVAKK
jgi:prostaglandin-H2 D-isomerase / glutathione transferase